jgi:site-specific DNA-methyltransferase (adenine-specific)
MKSKIKLISIKEIKENPNNPRKLNKDKYQKLLKSIQDLPQMLEYRPIVVNSDMVVLGGNMRLKALKELKYKEVPIIIADELSEDQQKEFLIKDNLGYGEWDWDMIANEWDLPMLEDWGMDLPTDFTTQEELEAVEDDFDIPDEVQTDIVVGDLFEIGEHRLLCGDSTDSDAVETLMNGEKYDLIITDPPYNVALGMETKEQAKARNRRTDGLIIQNDKMSDSDFVKFLTDYFTTTLLSTKKGGGIYVFFADMELRSFVDAFLDGGFKLSQQLIWLKQTMVMGRKDYHCKHEPILYGWYEGEAHNWYSDRKQTTILEFDRPQRNGEHPTMKPIKLIEYLMTNSSKEGDLIGDGFLGSGSTMVASHQLKRKCYGMELDPKYCQVIIDRMIKLDPTIKIKKNGKPYAKPH